MERIITLGTAFDRTYEGLKRTFPGVARLGQAAFDRTYEGLKQVPIGPGLGPPDPL